MNLHELSLRRRPFRFLCASVLISAIVLFSGCGGDDKPQTITIELVPTSLDFDSADNLYIVERSSKSLWKFTLVQGTETGTGVLYPPTQGGFTPWGLSTDARFLHDMLFVTDVTEGAQRLMAIDNRFGSEVLSDSRILAEIATFDSTTAGGTPDDHFSGLRAVTAYTLEPGGSVVRVFVADQARVVVFDYDVSSEPPAFVFENILTSPAGENCPHAFDEPYGVAVDRDNHYLYVADYGGDRLYQFSGVDTSGPSCDGEVEEGGGEALDRPQGVTVMAGQDPGPNQVLVADSGNDRIASFTWSPPNLVFAEKEGTEDRPFDLAFDTDMNLWATFPEIKRIYQFEWPPP
jgi:hypothetical protein